MSQSTHQAPRALLPRRLDQKESLNSLNQWKTTFRNYYRRCPYYGLFLLPATSWDDSPTRGFVTETSGLKRDVPTLVADLEGFLDCIASFLPFDYLGDKLKRETNNITQVWNIIYEVYDAELTTTNFLDYGSMSRQEDETYRGYYNRLVGFVRQHLPQEAISSEGVSCPNTGEQLTIGLLDAIAIHWLLNINPKLLPIVKTEFATDLKTKRLCQMVKPISQSIDELLQRYDTKDQVSAVSSQAATSETDLSSLVRRMERIEVNFVKQSRRRLPPNQKKIVQDRCSHCLFLNRQLGQISALITVVQIVENEMCQ